MTETQTAILDLVRFVAPAIAAHLLFPHYFVLALFLELGYWSIERAGSRP